MIAGIILSKSTEKESHIAFLGDGTDSFSVSTNQELVDKIAEKQPEVVAVNSGSEITKEPLTDQEEELKEEGFSFNPTASEKRKVKRLQALKAQIGSELDISPKIIRFDPKITSENLAIHGDQGLESLGVETEDISSAGEFDAVLGAITARFYQQDQFRDLGVIIPRNLDEESE